MRVLIRSLLLLGLLVCVGCGHKKSTEELLADLKSSHEGDRVAAVRLLPGKGDPATVVPALMNALRDKHSDIRWSAAIGLGSFADQAAEAIPALQIAQADRDARVREAAKVALHRIDPAKFPDPTKQPLERKKG